MLIHTKCEIFNFTFESKFLSDNISGASIDLKDSSCLAKFLVTKKALFSTLSSGSF